jgi:CubicO group peptidase (beta-lactamase class C family)
MKTLACIIVLLLGVGPSWAQTTYSKEIEEEIRQVENNLAGRVIINGKPDHILDRMAHFNVKGLSIAVVQNYEVRWAKGYGWADEKEKRPVTTETLFEPGSISKSLNAVGVLRLAQDKRLDLDSDINTYLKSWKFPYDTVSKNKVITLTHLLGHSAGLSVWGFPGYDRKAKLPTVQEILDGKPPANTPAVRSIFEPGTQVQYSGGGILISQLMVADVTGQPYDQFMRRNILKPLGMTHSFFSQPPPRGKSRQLATGYHGDGSEVENKYYVYPEQSAAGLWTTPTDLCKYIVATQLAYEGRSSKVLNSELTRLQLTPPLDGVAALGVFIDNRNGTKYFQHDARNNGFCGVYYGSLEGGNGVAIFLNSDNPGILPEVLNSVASVYQWKDFYHPVHRNEIAVEDSILEKYVGTYLFEGNLAYVSKGQDGYYYWASGINSKMHFSSDKEFFNQEFRAEKTFVADASGHVTGYERRVDGKEFPVAVKIHRLDTLMAPINQLNGLAWHLLETKRFAEAIPFLERARVLEPENTSVAANLAHGYLFTHAYEKAIRLYREYLGKEITPGTSIADIIQQDFVHFKKRGFDVTLMDRVVADLDLEMPAEHQAR